MKWWVVALVFYGASAGIAWAVYPAYSGYNLALIAVPSVFATEGLLAHRKQVRRFYRRTRRRLRRGKR